MDLNLRNKHIDRYKLQLSTAHRVRVCLYNILL